MKWEQNVPAMNWSELGLGSRVLKRAGTVRVVVPDDRTVLQLDPSGQLLLRNLDGGNVRAAAKLPACERLNVFWARAYKSQFLLFFGEQCSSGRVGADHSLFRSADALRCDDAFVAGVDSEGHVLWQHALGHANLPIEQSANWPMLYLDGWHGRQFPDDPAPFLYRFIHPTTGEVIEVKVPPSDLRTFGYGNGWVELLPEKHCLRFAVRIQQFGKFGPIPKVTQIHELTFGESRSPDFSDLDGAEKVKTPFRESP
jgi:hypothetical protein